MPDILFKEWESEREQRKNYWACSPKLLGSSYLSCSVVQSKEILPATDCHADCKQERREANAGNCNTQAPSLFCVSRSSRQEWLQLLTHQTQHNTNDFIKHRQEQKIKNKKPAAPPLQRLWWQTNKKMSCVQQGSLSLSLRLCPVQTTHKISPKQLFVSSRLFFLPPYQTCKM